MKLNYVNTLARIESLCTFRVRFRSPIESISFTKQSNLFLHFFKTVKRPSGGPSGLRSAVRGSVYILKMPIVYVHPHVCVSVRAYSPHSPHHTGHIENDKRRVVELFDDLWLRFAYFKILANLRLANTG